MDAVYDGNLDVHDRVVADLESISGGNVAGRGRGIHESFRCI